MSYKQYLYGADSDVLYIAGRSFSVDDDSLVVLASQWTASKCSGLTRPGESSNYEVPAGKILTLFAVRYNTITAFHDLGFAATAPTYDVLTATIAAPTKAGIDGIYIDQYEPNASSTFRESCINFTVTAGKFLFVEGAAAPGWCTVFGRLSSA